MLWVILLAPVSPERTENYFSELNKDGKDRLLIWVHGQSNTRPTTEGEIMSTTSKPMKFPERQEADIEQLDYKLTCFTSQAEYKMM